MFAPPLETQPIIAGPRDACVAGLQPHAGARAGADARSAARVRSSFRAARRGAARRAAAGQADAASVFTDASTSSTWPFTDTFGQCLRTLPSAPISTVERMIPFEVLP